MLSCVVKRASQVALVVKNLSADAGDVRDAGSIPLLGRSPGEGHSNPLQYFCLENPMDKGARWTIHKVTQSRTWLTWLSTHADRHVVRKCFQNAQRPNLRFVSTVEHPWAGAHADTGRLNQICLLRDATSDLCLVLCVPLRLPSQVLQTLYELCSSREKQHL